MENKILPRMSKLTLTRISLLLLLHMCVPVSAEHEGLKQKQTFAAKLLEGLKLKIWLRKLYGTHILPHYTINLPASETLQCLKHCIE